MDKDRVEGSGKKMKGDLKQAAGRVLGDKKLEGEGHADRAEGGIQNAAGSIKDAARDIFKKH